MPRWRSKRTSTRLSTCSAAPPRYAFTEFYVRVGFVGEERARRLRSLYADAYIEDWPDGFFVSTWELGNPAGIGIRERASLLSIQAGKIIAEVD
jgi:hypothetical protein